jgi:hypothetical protein
MACGRTFPVAEYAEELPEDIWERIALRGCDRA